MAASSFCDMPGWCSTRARMMNWARVVPCSRAIWSVTVRI
jgi:hypothetical protein